MYILSYQKSTNLPCNLINFNINLLIVLSYIYLRVLIVAINVCFRFNISYSNYKQFK